MRHMAMVAIAALGVGCASAGHIQMVESEYWKNEDFASYKRYAWLPNDAHRRAETQPEDHRLHDLIREAIDEQLTARGYVPSPARDADFLVTYHCKITQELEADVVDRVWYGAGEESRSEEVPPRVELSTFDQGSIVVDLVKPDGSHWVWRGVARGPVSLDATPEQLREVVDRSVREILDEFPPPR